ncbi:MAG: hypothetical protein RQ885_03650 [Desulfurococcales archaeon]|jgi:hypothetical protein|nr:hypothetical protein [Desulfurococcales archaeon]
MIKEMVEYALDHNASQKTLYRAFYKRYRDQYPWTPPRIIKGSYRDAIRRARALESVGKRVEHIQTDQRLGEMR